MRKTPSTKQLRDLRLNARAAARLARFVTPYLLKNLVESLEIGERVRRRRMSSRERRLRRSLRVGAYAVGVAAVGAVAARRVGHGSDGPELDRL
jgi:hypothetical protein